MDVFWLPVLLLNGCTTVYHVRHKDAFWAAIGGFACGGSLVMLLQSFSVGG